MRPEKGLPIMSGFLLSAWHHSVYTEKYKIFNKQRIMNDKVNTVVIGKLIKEELQRQGKTSVWLANELGCHRTNIYKVYDRTTIDTGMLFHISKILKVDFFKYY